MVGAFRGLSMHIADCRAYFILTGLYNALESGLHIRKKIGAIYLCFEFRDVASQVRNINRLIGVQYRSPSAANVLHFRRARQDASKRLDILWSTLDYIFLRVHNRFDCRTEWRL